MATANVTKTVTTIAQAQTTKLNKATEAVAKIVADLQKANNSFDELVTNVELKQGELDSLTNEFDSKKRAQEAELKLLAKENESALVNEILEKQGNVVINAKELETLRNELSSIKSEFSANVSSEVKKAVAIVASRHESELKTKDLQFVADTASLKAELGNKSSIIESLTSQVGRLEKQIDDERSARIEIAKAASGEQVVVNTGK